MDVTEVAPFSNVECPACHKHTRVKREFGPYTLLRRHAIGGMSVVFIAHDNTLDREVVVKILNEEYGSDEKRIGAFEEEARITASFSHPHVVRVFTTGRAFERFYIAMELVPGGHFEHHIRERGSIPEKEMLPLAIQITAGLKAAQTAGLIHRDMKPGNILLDGSGNAKIVDFGLALVTKGGKATATEIWATPYYVPPEAIEGLPEDFRSDMYAFGATLYHALAGKPSCNEESMDTNRLRDAKKKISPLAKVAPWVSPDTCAVIDRAMAHDPAQRFRSYDDLSAALEASRQRLAGVTAAPGPAKGGNGSRRHASSRFGEKLALAGATLFLLGAIGFGGWWVFKPEDPVVKNGTPSATESTKAPDRGRSGDNGARIGSAYREAGDALRTGNYSKARELFVEVRNEPGVLEPTGSWAACEAVICCYLDGRPEEARKEAEASSDHAHAADTDEAMRSVLLEGLDRVGDLRTVSLSADAGPLSGPGVLAALLGGLKNWEHGMPTAARPHFETILAVEPKGADAWVAPYQKIVRTYLADAEKLRATEFAEFPTTAAACRGLADELHAVYSGLKTKGRARFNVRALQLELEKRAMLLENSGEPVPAPVPVVNLLADARKAAAACHFSEAAVMIKSPDFATKAGEGVSSAILLLAEAAAGFLGELEDKLQSPPSGIALELRDKTKLDQITGTRSGGIKTLDATGSPRDISWGEISPDSVIELHRLLIKDEVSEIERLRRHEQAIAFDLLAGDAERGKKAGAGLAARYPAFKRRWDLVQPALE